MTIFDSVFLPQGLALALSLAEHCPGATLWVLCVDGRVAQNLKSLAPANVRTIDVAEIEDERLLAAKADRSSREYCWTLTPFSFDAVFDRCAEAARVTYLDADLFFFGSAVSFFEEMDSSGASVMITEHNYDPAYDKTETVGRFCVQFLTMKRSSRAREIRHWWQNRVLEWCYDRCEPGRFGDQKYLDQWPHLFGSDVHILNRREAALAPWNVRMEAAKAGGRLSPMFYHFHSFRLVDECRARLVEAGYAIPEAARPLYMRYIDAIRQAISRMRKVGIDVPLQPIPTKAFPWARHLAKKLLGRADLYARLSGAT